MAELPQQKQSLISDIQPIPLPLDILYEEDEFLVLNKQSDLSVHPAPGQDIITLVHGLLYKYPKLSDLGGPFRPGIVHRLDRFTSGVMLIAKTNRAHENISSQFANREVQKEYSAIVEGIVEFDQNEVEQPIARHKKQRQKMAVDIKRGKSSTTYIEVSKRFTRHSFVICRPLTGRRHQIRVHCLHLGHRILGDKLYGGKIPITANDLCKETTEDSLDTLLNRPALHAKKIALKHPISQEKIEFAAPLPEDIEKTLKHLNFEN